MNKHKKIMAVWEHYVAHEIGIEFKACLYFFCILFFYSMYRLVNGIYVADILHMTEMIFLTYAMGYVQVYLLSNFDEADSLRARELSYLFLCSLVYTAVSYLGRWFDRSIAVSIGFMAYISLTYFCAFFVYRTRRRIDEKRLNEDLKAFQERRQNEKCD